MLKALNHARHIIYPKNALPLFGKFFFTFGECELKGTMTVQASNGSEWIKETVLLDKPAVDPRPISVWYGDILKAIRSLDEQPLLFQVGEMQMTVKHSCGSFRLPLGNDAEEFLGVPRIVPDVEADDGYLLEYEAPVLRSIFSRCKFAMAQDELRPVMNGVYVNLTDEFADYVSSDGHKLVRVRKDPFKIVTDYKANVSFIFPANVVRTLLRLMPVTGDVEIKYQEPLYVEEPGTDVHGRSVLHSVCKRKLAASVVINDTLTYSFRPVDGKYPKYWTVIPENFYSEMVIDRVKLVKSVNRLAIFASESSGMMKMSLTDDRCMLSAEDNDFELAGDETLPCEIKGTIGLTIGVQAQSLADTLKSISAEKVIFSFQDSTRAFIIKPKPQPDTEDITMLLMPMLIN